MPTKFYSSIKEAAVLAQQVLLSMNYQMIGAVRDQWRSRTQLLKNQISYEFVEGGNHDDYCVEFVENLLVPQAGHLLTSKSSSQYSQTCVCV